MSAATSWRSALFLAILMAIIGPLQMSGNIHSDNHMSGFFYLKCNEHTSLPVFHDPRPGALMTGLKQKDKRKLSYANDQIHYIPKPGSLILFNSYMPHQYTMHDGYEDFRFIHFNIQAVRNMIVEGVKNENRI